MKSITVFCGSNTGNREVYSQTAVELGRKLAHEGIRLVYGGGKLGLMGILADSCLEHGGSVIGIIPEFLMEKEIGNLDVTELLITKDMHGRKLAMLDNCDGALALPGGFGTLDELFEMVTWAQLHLHEKPIGILNVDGYFDALLAFLDHMVDVGFLSRDNRDMLLVDATMDGVLSKMARYRPTSRSKWLKKQ